MEFVKSCVKKDLRNRIDEIEKIGDRRKNGKIKCAQEDLKTLYNIL